MTEPDAAPSPCSPSLAPPLTPTTANQTLGFLTFLNEPTGLVGGYLLTNAWGRPLEFRLSTAVQPTRVQQILYGPTLEEYLHAELIGKALVEKAIQPPTLIITDRLVALSLRDRLAIPVIAVRTTPIEDNEAVIPLAHPRSSVMLSLAANHAADRAAIEERLERIDPAVDLAEPFARIREAVAEARKTGAMNRAA